MINMIQAMRDARAAATARGHAMAPYIVRRQDGIHVTFCRLCGARILVTASGVWNEAEVAKSCKE